MKRYFYLSADLDDLDAIERELEREGVARPQIHVISHDDAGLDLHQNINQVHQWFQTNVVHSTLKGALVGLMLASLIIVVAVFSGLTNTIGMVPFVFLSVVLLGFCTWEAGFIGTQLPNQHFKKFEKALNNGKHLLMVDVDSSEKKLLKRVVARHPKLHKAGVARGAPRWTLFSQKKAQQFAEWAP